MAAVRERAEELQKEMAARKAAAGENAEVAAALAELAQRVSEVNGVQGEQEFGFFALRLPGGEPATLHKVAAALTGLLMIVDGADAAPTADAQRAAGPVEAAGAGGLARGKAVEGDLAGLDAVLGKAELPPLGK